jgi:nicotinamidase-related amidase
VKTVILTGLSTDGCVVFTASDAFVRDLNLVVAKDCCAADSPEHHDQAMEMMRRVLEADIRPSAEIDFDELARSASSASDE